MKNKNIIWNTAYLFLGLLLIVSSCKKDKKTTTENVVVGQSYQGGIVAYVLQSGDPGYKSGEMHGIIAAPADLDSMAEWGCEGTAILGTNDTTFGSGNQNSTNISNGCSKARIAAKLCIDFEINGYSDWYLPNKQELGRLYINRVSIGGFSDNRTYWSSSQYDGKYAWKQSFLGGVQYSFDKSSACFVRAVRSF